MVSSSVEQLDTDKSKQNSGVTIGLDKVTRSQVTGVKPQVRVSQSQVAELKLGSTLPTPNSRKG
jgi:hypothetical protein